MSNTEALTDVEYAKRMRATRRKARGKVLGSVDALTSFVLGQAVGSLMRAKGVWIVILDMGAVDSYVALLRQKFGAGDDVQVAGRGLVRVRIRHEGTKARQFGYIRFVAETDTDEVQRLLAAPEETRTLLWDSGCNPGACGGTDPGYCSQCSVKLGMGQVEMCSACAMADRV